MKKTFLNISIIIISLFVGLSIVDAAELTVCATNCDHNTIAAAVTAATGGDTIKVKAGSYAGFTLSSKALTFTGEGTPTITSAINLSSSKSTITGFDLRNATINVTAGNVTINNNLLSGITASGTSVVDATLNFWGASPVFASLITKQDNATVTYDPYYRAQAHVGSNITSMELSTNKKTIEVGEHYNFPLTVNPTIGISKIRFTSANEAIAKVNDEGTITGIKEGTVKITATAPWGDPYEVTITVECGDVDNPKTSIEYYIIGFGLLIISGLVLGYKNFKKAKELM